MHELAVTQSILDIALRHARTAGARRIVGIHLRLGQLSSMVDDSVQFYWDIISADTPAQGAQLRFERVPAELCCLECGRIFRPGADTFDCPACSSPHVRVHSGDDLRVESIDVE
jgi:hydrogenase nickel incorporation protein HypA/HybF